jgi:hypothetical protein
VVRWTGKASADGVAPVFISPFLSDPIQVLGTLLHEKVHAVVGVEFKHGKHFRTLAVACGLTGKMTATTIGDDLNASLRAMAGQLGPYPHPAFDPSMSPVKKQTTRMIKLVAGDECGCGYTVRTTRRWIEEGLPSCPHFIEMVEVE